MSPSPDDFDQTILSLEKGETLSGRYKLIRELGRGGMGVVWLAEDTALDHQVALKLLPAALGQSSRAIGRLKQEAKRNLQLTHPHIVRLLTFEQDAARHNLAYLVMQYIEGQTLDDLLDVHPNGLPLHRIQQLAMQIGQAIDFAHSKGVLHRDIKPSNIIINPYSGAYLMDFGIAREAKDTITRITGRDSSGTLPYMSPQQLRGENSRSNDIYSFAATLYEALSGQPPFSTGDLQFQIIREIPKSISTQPNQVNNALLSGLSKKVENRPSSATNLAKTLSGITPSNVAVASPKQKNKPKSKAKRKNKSRSFFKSKRFTFPLIFLLTLILSAGFVVHYNMTARMELGKYLRSTDTLHTRLLDIFDTNDNKKLDYFYVGSCCLKDDGECELRKEENCTAANGTFKPGKPCPVNENCEYIDATKDTTPTPSQKPSAPETSDKGEKFSVEAVDHSDYVYQWVYKKDDSDEWITTGDTSSICTITLDDIVKYQFRYKQQKGGQNWSDWSPVATVTVKCKTSKPKAAELKKEYFTDKFHLKDIPNSVKWQVRKLGSEKWEDVDNDFTYNQVGKWEVRHSEKNDNCEWSDFSNPQTIKVVQCKSDKPNQPWITQENLTTGTDITFEVNDSSGEYEWKITDLGTITVPGIYKPETNKNTLKKKFSVDGDYEICCRIKKLNCEWSDWSDSLKFTVSKPKTDTPSAPTSTKKEYSIGENVVITAQGDCPNLKWQQQPPDSDWEDINPTDASNKNVITITLDETDKWKFRYRCQENDDHALSDWGDPLEITVGDRQITTPEPIEEPKEEPNEINIEVGDIKITFIKIKDGNNFFWISAPIKTNMYLEFLQNKEYEPSVETDEYNFLKKKFQLKLVTEGWKMRDGKKKNSSMSLVTGGDADNFCIYIQENCNKEYTFTLPTKIEYEKYYKQKDPENKLSRNILSNDRGEILRDSNKLDKYKSIWLKEKELSEEDMGKPRVDVGFRVILRRSKPKSQ